MHRKPKYTRLQNIDRHTRYMISCMFMLFYPENKKIYKWWQIILVFAFFTFIGFMVSISR